MFKGIKWKSKDEKLSKEITNSMSQGKIRKDLNLVGNAFQKLFIFSFIVLSFSF